MKYETIIFDLDGTLVDSKINFAEIYKKLNLNPGHSIIEHINTLNEKERKSALEIVHYYEEEGARLSSLMPGVSDLLQSLKLKNINVGVFTLNSKAIAIKTLEFHKINIPIVITREDAKPKPDPEGLLKICEHYRTPKDKVLYIGDYKYDLIAGKNADIKTALYTKTIPDFDTHDAHFQFCHFNELKNYIISS